MTFEWWMVVPAWFAVAGAIVLFNHAAATLRKRQERRERCLGR